MGYIHCAETPDQGLIKSAEIQCWDCMYLHDLTFNGKMAIGEICVMHIKAYQIVSNILWLSVISNLDPGSQPYNIGLVVAIHIAKNTQCSTCVPLCLSVSKLEKDRFSTSCSGGFCTVKN